MATMGIDSPLKNMKSIYMCKTRRAACSIKLFGQEAMGISKQSVLLKLYLLCYTAIIRLVIITNQILYTN